MAALVDSGSNIIVQGSCTRRGMMLMEHMLDYNTNLCAGVCYLNKKDIQVRGVPVYHHLADAVNDFPAINVSIIAGGPFEVYQNCMEALESGIRLIIIHTDLVPVKDAVLIAREATKYHAVVIGPDSAGIINPDVAMVGSMGGIHALSVYRKGTTGIISRSNGLINEASIVLKNAGMGVSTAVGLGTEKIMMSSFKDIYPYFENDEETRVILLIGGPGGRAEEEFVEFYSQRKNKKPVIAFLSGHFVDRLPAGYSFGHISALKGKGQGSIGGKARLMEKAGIKVAPFISDVPKMIKRML